MLTARATSNKTIAAALQTRSTPTAPNKTWAVNHAFDGQSTSSVSGRTLESDSGRHGDIACCGDA
eukprot:10170699-Lingulodinium_polyedra.AAC.1